MGRHEDDSPRRSLFGLLPGVVTLLTTIGVFSYAFIYAYLVRFYLQLGLYPSAAGLSQSEILSRATWPLVWLSISLLLLVAMLVAAAAGLQWLGQRLHPKVAGTWVEQPVGWVRRLESPFGAALLAALVLTVFDGISVSNFIEVVGFTLLLWPLAVFIDKRRLPRVTLAVVTVVALAGLLLPAWGSLDADNFKRTGEIQDRAFLLGVEMQYVIAEKSQTPPPATPGRVYVMLGASGNIIVLYDCKNGNVYRMYIGSILLRGHAFSPFDDAQTRVAAAACLSGTPVPDLP
ncbi:MAG: hypothetical protein ACXV5Q_05830 [Frankiaceae bacterium]